MKIVYIAGPYRAKNGSTVIENVRRAERVAIKYWRMGHAVLCPHTNSAFMDGVCPDKTFLEGGLRFVEVSDIVVMMKNYEESPGAVAEHAHAKALAKEIIYE